MYKIIGILLIVGLMMGCSGVQVKITLDPTTQKVQAVEAKGCDAFHKTEKAVSCIYTPIWSFRWLKDLLGTGGITGVLGSVKKAAGVK